MTVQNENISKFNFENFVPSSGRYPIHLDDESYIPEFFDDYEKQVICSPTLIEEDLGLNLCYPDDMDVENEKLEAPFDKRLHMKFAMECLHNDDEVIKIVAQHPETGIKMSGYFVDVMSAISNIQLAESMGFNTFMNLNPIRLSERINDRIVANKLQVVGNNKKEITKQDVKRIKYFVVNVNRIKLDGDEALYEGDHYFADNEAEYVAWRVLKFMKEEMGFTTCLMAFSGRGYHLIWKVDLAPTKKNEELLQRCLLTLAYKFNSDGAEINTANYKKDDLIRIYGTVNFHDGLKEKFPCYRSNLVHAPNRMIVVPKYKLEALVEQLPEDIEQVHKSLENHIDIVNTIKYQNRKLRIEKFASKFFEKYNPRSFAPSKLVRVLKCEYEKESGESAEEYCFDFIIDNMFTEGDLSNAFKHMQEGIVQIIYIFGILYKA